MRFVAVVLLAIYLPGCGKDMGTEILSLSLPAAVELRVGQSVVIAGDSPVTITFEGVTQDSRCPIGAVCFWEGDGEAKISIRSFESNAVACTLHTTLDPRIVAAAGITVRLKSLVPVPKVDTWINRLEYVVTLDIRSCERCQILNSPVRRVLRGLVQSSPDGVL